MSGAANHDDDAAQRDNDADRERFVNDEAFDEFVHCALSDLCLEHQPHAEFVRDTIYEMVFGDEMRTLPKLQGCDLLTGQAVDAALGRAWVSAQGFRCTRIFVSLGCDDDFAEDLMDCLDRVKGGLVTYDDAAKGMKVPDEAIQYWMMLLRNAANYAKKYPGEAPPIEIQIAVFRDAPESDSPAATPATTPAATPAAPPKTYAAAVQDPALEKIEIIDLPAYARNAWGDSTKFFAASALYSDASCQPHAVAWKVRVAAAKWTMEGLQNASSGWRGNALKAAPRVVAATRGAVTYVMCAARSIKKIDPQTRVTILRDETVAPVTAAPKYAKWASPANVPTFLVADLNGDDICDRWVKDKVTFGVSMKRKGLSVDVDTFATKRAVWELTFPKTVSISSVYKFATGLKHDSVMMDQYGHVFGWTPLTDAQIADAKTKARFFLHQRAAATGSPASGAEPGSAAADKLVEVTMTRNDGLPMEEGEAKEVAEGEKLPYVRVKFGIRLVTFWCSKEQAAQFPDAVEQYIFIRGSGGLQALARAPAAAGPPDDPGDDAAPPSAAADGRGV